MIHRRSPRNNRPFVAVNCASIPDALLESELFGHEKGAFTNAYTTKQGLVEVANGGTLFLDEVGDISPAIQPKLLRFLETGEFRRVGGTNLLTVDVRVVSATNKDLREEVKAGRFREDLLYRLNVVTLQSAAAARAEGRHPRSCGVLPCPEGQIQDSEEPYPRCSRAPDGLRLARERPRTGACAGRARCSCRPAR